jgi:2,4-dienoyl-CoA reductase-like NADH-dependent reductase (Old Yellow Enzyme family)
MEWIQEIAGNRVPVIGVGSIHSPDEAMKALEMGVPLIALGREIIMEPDWVSLVADGRESEIKTTLTKEDQDRLIVPTPLWNAIMHTPGWFPVVESSIK